MRFWKKRLQRVAAMVCSVALVASMMPTAAFATEPEPTPVVETAPTPEPSESPESTDAAVTTPAPGTDADSTAAPEATPAGNTDEVDRPTGMRRCGCCSLRGSPAESRRESFSRAERFALLGRVYGLRAPSRGASVG